MKDAEVVLLSDSAEFFEGRKLDLCCKLKAGNHVSYKWLLNGQPVAQSPLHYIADNVLLIHRSVDSHWDGPWDSCYCITRWLPWCSEQLNKCVVYRTSLLIIFMQICCKNEMPHCRLSKFFCSMTHFLQQISVWESCTLWWRPEQVNRNLLYWIDLFSVLPQNHFCRQRLVHVCHHQPLQPNNDLHLHQLWGLNHNQRLAVISWTDEIFHPFSGFIAVIRTVSFEQSLTKWRPLTSYFPQT